MADFHKKSTISITCPLGLAPFLKKEVQQLGYPIRKSRETGIETEGDLNDTIRMNYLLRTAHRIHFLLEEKKADTPENLQQWLKGLPWEEWIPRDGYFSVTSRVDHPAIENDQYANLIVKDAVADRIRSVKGERPDSGSGLDRSVVFLFWTRNIARIFIDTSGESLSRRNYRTTTSSAPMQETLAAGIVSASRWVSGQHFINPMTGSGTIVIEAAMIALNRAPASLRNNFGFMYIPGFDEEFYQAVREQAKQNTLKEPAGRFIATDIDPAAVTTARKHARTAGLDHIIEFQTCDIADTPVPDGDGVVIINPPYGMRLGKTGDLSRLYKRTGDFMKKQCPGKTGYVFTANMELAKSIGLRASSRTRFFNSTLECRLLEYELYKGSKKT